MPLQDITTVNIELATSAVSRTGFGTPLFIGAHRWFPERIRTYASITEVAEDIPAGSQEYIAAAGFFAQSPAPSQIKIGRRNASVLIDPSAPEEYEEFTITITDTDGDVLAVSVQADAGDTEEDIVDAIILAIAGDDVGDHVSTVKNGVGAATTLTLSTTLSTDKFSLSGISSNLAYSPSGVTETAATVLAAIEAVDNDFYIITAHDHTSTFVLAMAAAVETRAKLYFVSGQSADYIGTLADPATDLFGELMDLNYFRTATLFHHTADTTFPETAFVGKNIPFEPGTITWANKRLAGVSVSQDPTTELNLSSTQLNNLSARNANVVQNIGGISVTREGKTAAGEWIDVMSSRDLLVARITEAYQNTLINSGKIPYTDSGINAMRSVLTSVLSRYVSTKTQPNILQETNPFTTDFPTAASVSFEDKATRILNASFVAYLAGAIHIVNIEGKLTIQTDA